MGKSKKSRRVAMFRSDPTKPERNGDEINFDGVDGQLVKTSVIDTIEAQLTSVNIEDKVCACYSISNLCSEEEVRKSLIDRKLVRICCPLILESDPHLVEAALAGLYSLSCQGEETVTHLVQQDVLTPLFSLVNQFKIPGNVYTKVKSQMFKVMDEAFSLLWNLLEEDDSVLAQFNKANVLDKVVQFLSPDVAPHVQLASLNLLVAACEDNEPAQQKMSSRIDLVMEMIRREGSMALVRVTASLLLITICQDRQQLYNNKEIINLILDCITNCLKVDTNALVASLLSGNSDPKDPEKQFEMVKNIIKSQVTALEILTNLASGDDEEFHDESDGEFEDDDRSDSMEEGELVDMNSEERMFVEAVHSSNLLQHVLARSAALPGELQEKLNTSGQGKLIVKAGEELQTDCYLCLSNLTDMMTITQLGGGEAVRKVWLALCSQLCANSASLQLLESLSCAVRSLTSQLCREDSGVSLDTVSITDLEHLVAVYTNNINVESNSTRTNIVNVLGNLGCLAARSLADSTCSLIVSKLTSWMLEVVVNDASLRVTLEGLDKFIDIFSGDETDKMFEELNILTKLHHIFPTIKSRIKKDKKKLGEDIAVANTVRLNLQKFIKYKERIVATR